MKDFKKLIREAYLGNPLNESVTPFTRVHYIASPAPRKMLVQDLKDLFGDDLETVTNFMDDGGYESVLVFNLRDSDIERIEDEIGDVITGEYSLKKVKEIQEALNEENEKFDHIARAEYGKPWILLSIAQKQEMLSALNRETEKQFQTDYERRRRGDYSDDREDGMTDYQRGRMDEDMGEWPKELTSRYSDEYRFELEKVMSDRAKYRVIDIESGELKGTPVFGTPESLMAYADDLIKPQGGTQSSHFGTNEGTCGYTPDGEPRSKPASPDLNEDLEVDIITYPDNKELRIKIPGDFKDNEGESAVRDALEKQGIEFESFKVQDIKLPLEEESDTDVGGGAKQAIGLNIDDEDASDAALDSEVNKMGYNESKTFDFKKMVKEALTPGYLKK